VVVSNPKAIERLRPQVFGAILLICVQSGIGMFVNLFVTIPRHHSGANPANYFGGSMRSVAWAIDHGAIALAIHVILGLLLAVMVIGIVARAFALGRASLIVWSILGALGTIGAGFTGAGFLDFNEDVSSFFMAILAFASLVCFTVVLYLALPSSPAATSAPEPTLATNND
jgi:hypothetical protein